MQKYDFTVTGMSCTACAARVEKAARSVPGVVEAQVNLVTGEMHVVSKDGDCAQDIIRAVQGYGFGAQEKQNSAAPRIVGGNRGWAVILSVMLLLPLVALHHVVHGAEWMQAALALGIAALNYRFFTRGVRTMVEGDPGMDALVALGGGVALADGLVQLCIGGGGAMFLESAGMILTFVSVGKWLEARATRRTGRAVEKLNRLLPEVAVALRSGQQVQVATALLQQGDCLLVRPGDRIPADGTVLRGVSSADESALTGESMPVDKQEGSDVYAGTVNLQGVLHVRVTKPQEQSALSGVIRLVSNAAAQKAPVARMADRVARVFVPTVVAVAGVTAIVWWACGATWDVALARAVAVMVVSCPCALGLATPVAIMVGAGKGAEWGILFRNGEAIEAAGRANCVALDKTGTLTMGEPSVTDVCPHGCTRDELLGLAAALENGANHPLARAVLACAEPIVDVPDLQSIPGRGVRGTVQGIACAVGNAELMRELGVELQELPESMSQGKTILHVARGAEWLGCLAVADAPRESAPRAVAALQAMGMRTLMMTGDHAAAAHVIGDHVGLQEVHAGALPQDKERILRTLQAQGERVAMVGDGINDAPALACAQVGIAIGAGTDIARESAGVILMRSDPMDIARALQLSRAILDKIRQNLFLAFFYNVLMIPFAAGVFYPVFGWLLPPAAAAAAMGLSSLCVVTNALRLRNFCPTA